MVGANEPNRDNTELMRRLKNMVHEDIKGMIEGYEEQIKKEQNEIAQYKEWIKQKEAVIHRYEDVLKELKRLN